MGVKRSLKKPAWRRDIIVDPKVTRKLSRAGVLKSLESCLVFLERLKEKDLMDSPEWKAADEAYTDYLDEQLGNGSDLGEIKNRYYKLFKIPEKKKIVMGIEDFPGEYRFSHHIQHPAEYGLAGEGDSK